MLMRLLKTLIFCAFLCSSSVIFSHQRDELVILEIEQGQLDFQDQGMTAEYEYIAAIKRQRMRKLEAMPWPEKIFVIY